MVLHSCNIQPLYNLDDSVVLWYMAQSGIFTAWCNKTPYVKQCNNLRRL